MALRDETIFVAGHRGMVGSAIVRRLEREGCKCVLTASRDELDLRHAWQVGAFFAGHRIDRVVLAAAKVGGIHANRSQPAEFLQENLAIATNVVHAAHRHDIDRLLFLGSSCIYPRDAAQPIVEEALLTGPLEPTNEAYAIAKIAGVKLCQSYHRQYGRDYRSLMPTNLYGPNDNFHPEHSHVVPALLLRFREAERRGDALVRVWGSGRPRREFMYVDDLADACVHVMGLDAISYRTVVTPALSHLNAGTGSDCTIEELARAIASIAGYRGGIAFDPSMPDGPPRKLLDVSRLRELGWASRVGLRDGLRQTFEWLVAQPTLRER